MSCILEVYDITSAKRTVVKAFDGHIEAPNWTPDGSALIYNSGGLLYRYEPLTGESAQIPSGKCTRINNDHVISPDGTRLAISSGTVADAASRVYVIPIEGGEPRLVTAETPSYLHGWSPDGKTLAYCAQRNGNYDIYTISVDGGAETQLTDAEGLDDGPEYTPDGKYIWFNSVRAGLMQLFRMDADGGNQRQMTFSDDRNSWFPHVSPDGRKVVFLTYRAADVSPGEHPAGKNVEIRMMDSRGGEPETLFSLFGGQGTMNVNSWSPCGEKFAFVTYVNE